MSREHNSVLEEVSEEEQLLGEFEAAGERLRRELERAGVTREQLFAGQRDARRATFLKLYPELAHMVDTVNEDVP